MAGQIYTIGPLMKAARKFKKLNQADVAGAIGCSQSALSKMEHNLLVPSAPQWFLFSRFTSIPPTSLETGFIDRNSPVKFNDAGVSLGFKIPKRYRQQRAEKVREVYPFLRSLENESRELAQEFINSSGLDPEFFLDFDNLVNFHLIADVIDFFISRGMGTTEHVRKIVETGQDDIYWDHYKVDWKKMGSVQEVLDNFAKEQQMFQTDFQLKVEDIQGKVTVSYYPEYHIRQLNTFTPQMLQFLNTYRKLTIELLIKSCLEKEVTANLIQETQGTPLGARFEVKAA